MKNLTIVTIALLVFLVARAFAIEPEHRLWDKVNTAGSKSKTVYAVQMVLPEQPLSEVFEVVTIANSTDPIDVAAQLLPSSSNERGNMEKFVIRPDATGRWTWAMIDPITGGFMASNLVVGFDPPPLEMANVLWPTGNALYELESYIAEMYQPGIPTMVVNGDVELEFVFLATTDMDTTLTYQGVAYPCSLWSNMVFADTFLGVTPGGNSVPETVTKHMERSTNGQVALMPGADRGGHYDVPGIINPVDANGHLRAYVLPHTRDELNSNATLLGSVVSAKLQQEGIDYGGNSPYRALAYIWMQNWNSLPWASPMWPHGTWGGGELVSGAYYHSDMSMPGVLIHELGHSLFVFRDHYYIGTDYNRWDVMGRGSNNNGGWLVPHYPIPSCRPHGWWTVTDIESIDDYGLYHLERGSSLRIRNDYSNSDAGEEVYVTCVGNEGLVQRDRNVLVWWLNPDEECGGHG